MPWLFLYPSQFCENTVFLSSPHPDVLSPLRCWGTSREVLFSLFLKSSHQNQSKLLFPSRKCFIEKRGIHLGMPLKLCFRQWGLGFYFFITNGSGNTFISLLFFSQVPRDPFETSNKGSTWRYKGPCMHSHLNILISLSLFHLVYSAYTWEVVGFSSPAE